MTYRLLVLDLDGTVLGSDLSISPAVVHAISRAQSHGVVVTIATGRVYNSAIQFLPALGINQPIICFQGALVRQPEWGPVLYQAGLTGSQAVEALEMLQDAKIATLVFHGEHTVVGQWTPELDLYLSFHPGAEADVRVVDDLLSFAREVEPIKLLFSTVPEKLDEIVAWLDESMAGRVSVLRSHMYFGEVTAPGVDKGSAIESLASNLGIPREQVIAIGDEENDLSMIRWAGLGLAMGNSPDTVKSGADAVLPPLAEDGVAWAIDKYILGDNLRYCSEASQTNGPESTE